MAAHPGACVASLRLRTVIGKQPPLLAVRAIDDIAIDALDLHCLFERDLHLVHLRPWFVRRILVFMHRNLCEVALADAIRLHVALHDLGRKVRKDEDFARALIGCE